MGAREGKHQGGVGSRQGAAHGVTRGGKSVCRAPVREDRTFPWEGVMWVYPEIRTLGDIPVYYRRHDPDRLAFTFEGAHLRWGAVDDIVNRIANGFLAQELKTGDRVLYYGKNALNYYLALFAAAKIGAIFVPLNWRLAGPEIAPIVADCEPAIALVETDFLPAWRSLPQDGESGIRLLELNSGRSLEDWSKAQQASAPRIEIRFDDAAILLYTSGTTGNPKGVIHTHASLNHSRLSEHLEPAFQWLDGDCFLNALPNFHLLSVSLSLQCLYNGVAIAIVKQFDPAAVLAGIARDKASLLVLTPTMIQMLLDHPDAAATDFSSLRLTMYAGSPISLGLIKRAIALMPCQFMQFYGQTETSGPVSLLRPDEHNLENEQKLKSCGRPLPLISMKVVDAAGDELPPNQPGELLVRAAAASNGYWKQPCETMARFRDGWYYTADVAYRDEEGLFYIHDRVKDMIVSGGENIYSVEVENAVSLHPAVAAVAVIGVPDPRWGEAVKALVIPHQGHECTEADIIEFCRTRLAAYKVPKSVDFLEEFPMTGTGKVSKKLLSAPFWQGLERRVN
jgi:acyl-CoA synthetase (AMP-forming)/AMP-acid ligase II